MNINDTKKNIIVLKNLPSNIVDEAIIVIKNKKAIRELKNVKKDLSLKTLDVGDIDKLKKVSSKGKEYIVKEAEDVVNNYIEKLLDKDSEYKINKIEKRYNTLKYLCYLLSFVSLISTLICVIK